MGIVFDQVEKRYGSLFALRNISLEISPGEFVALLGANGAGKTTLLRVAALLARPTAGQLKFTTSAGSELQNPKQAIGIVAHNTLLYDELTAGENLQFFAELYGVPNPASRVLELLGGVDLAERSGSLVRTFSRGMRQRLTIARALLHSPRLLLLDEPASALDQQGREWFAETLGKLHRDGSTIVLSTHARNEALRMATRALRLAAGRLEADTGRKGDPRPLVDALQAES